MRLFDKYLLAVTNQRIPMPMKWQESLGLDLDEKKQIYAVNESEITGYRFQQDETINRGYVHREVRSLELDEQARYLISLYLNALKEHKKVNFTPYFNVGVTTYQFPYYTTKVSVIRGEKYSLFGSTLRPVSVRLYSEISNEDIASFTLPMLSLTNHTTVDTAKYFVKKVVPKPPVVPEKGVENYDEELKQYKENIKKYCEDNASELHFNTICDGSADEYLTLEIKSFVPVVVVQGYYVPSAGISATKKEDGTKEPVVQDAKLCFTAQQQINLFPSVGAKQLEYADKLMPLLTDMTITKDSPTEERGLVGSQYRGETFEDKVKKNTRGLYDIDEFIGGKFSW